MRRHVDSHLTAIDRYVHLIERDGKSAATVQLSRHFDVNRQTLWNAITSQEEISKWFASVSGDFKVGGSYAIENNASGVITLCEPITHVALTWEFAGDVSWVDVRLNNGSHSGVSFDLCHTSLLSPHWDQYGAGATGVGWELSYFGLYQYLVHPNEAKLDEEAFAASTAGKHLIRSSSQGWAEASILAGTTAETALGAAERTTSFYLGV
ncbi:MAG: SRPBCC domain-containing protein [Gammaproteobacteria bacterium]|nr:SRPBCC domain-containing protein [Gammaproteobacteria bacterium]